MIAVVTLNSSKIASSGQWLSQVCIPLQWLLETANKMLTERHPFQCKTD